MLVLSRKPGQKLLVGGVTFVVSEVRGNCVRIAIDAPEDVLILRGELASFYEEPAPDSDAEPVHLG